MIGSDCKDTGRCKSNYHTIISSEDPSQNLTEKNIMMMLYKCFFLQIPNFRFIRDSNRSAKIRSCVNVHPLLHKYLDFLK